MKKFVAFVMILSVGMFALGCNKPAAPAKKAGETKAPAAGTDVKPETKPETKPEGGPAPTDKAPETKPETK